jgi:CRISPR/Cas system-associated endoribonuclease Cas2
MMAGMLMGSLVLSSLPALAQPQNFDINRRIMHHQQRIQQAANSGQLSPKEYNRLEKELGRIQRMEAKMMRDGILTPYERDQLNRELDANSHNINLAIQNKGYRPPPPPPRY